MRFSEEMLHRFAIQAQRMIEESDRWDVKIEKVAEALGLPAAKGEQFARDLVVMGWATSTSGWLMPTPFGYAEIAKLKRPVRRWIDHHPLTVNAILMTGTGIIAGVIGSVITYLMG
jgi:hypothetical protein